jgi:hypothetical protein
MCSCNRGVHRWTARSAGCGGSRGRFSLSFLSTANGSPRCFAADPGALNKYERRHEMAQAIAHVVIHEWIHIATQSPAHGARGITKQFLSPAELTAEPRNNTVAIATH